MLSPEKKVVSKATGMYSGVAHFENQSKNVHPNCLPAAFLNSTLLMANNTLKYVLTDSFILTLIL
jgi:hypothetical protein